MFMRGRSWGWGSKGGGEEIGENYREYMCWDGGL